MLTLQTSYTLEPACKYRSGHGPQKGLRNVCLTIGHWSCHPPYKYQRLGMDKGFLSSWELMQEPCSGHTLAQPPARRDPVHHGIICGSGPSDFHRSITTPFYQKPKKYHIKSEWMTHTFPSSVTTIPPAPCRKDAISRSRETQNPAHIYAEDGLCWWF